MLNFSYTRTLQGLELKVCGLGLGLGLGLELNALDYIVYVYSGAPAKTDCGVPPCHARCATSLDNCKKHRNDASALIDGRFTTPTRDGDCPLPRLEDVCVPEPVRRDSNS